MKNLKSLILLFTLSVMSFSCSDDDDNQNSNNNFLIYGDTEVQLRDGIILNYGEYTPGVYNFDIVLIDSEINNLDGEPLPANDNFSGVEFELFTTNAEDLQVGVYTFGTDEANSYEYGVVFDNVSIESFDGSYINSGTFTVLDNGATYEFEFEGTVEDGTQFSGYFKGTLEAYDFSEEFDRPSVTPIIKNNKLLKKRR